MAGWQLAGPEVGGSVLVQAWGGGRAAEVVREGGGVRAGAVVVCQIPARLGYL